MTVYALEGVPLVGPMLKAWFLNGDTISNYTMSNFLFIHIGLSFSLLFGLWIHYVRMTRPVMTPPPAINYVLMALVLVFVFLFPITSGKMATLNGAPPTGFEMDWFFLAPYALMNVVPSVLVYWLIVVGITVVCCLLPMPWAFLIKEPPVEAAEVVLTKCVGCNLCYLDCPYQAIEMVPAPANSRFKLLATVLPYRCSGCGVCVGACAFDAIDLPDLPDANVLAQVKQIMEAK
jgi:NAD-dependent dihydropyrimidine dehydrogenase PreA subunit